MNTAVEQLTYSHPLWGISEDEGYPNSFSAPIYGYNRFFFTVSILRNGCRWRTIECKSNDEATKQAEKVCKKFGVSSYIRDDDPYQKSQTVH